jgi:hypothetical protein
VDHVASGEWVNDRTHGQQFKARFLRTSAPTSADGIQKVRHDPGSGFGLKTVARSAPVDAMWRDDNLVPHQPVPSVDGEAVEQAVAAGAPEVILATAAVWTA